MGLRKYLYNQRGQILIESAFLLMMLVVILSIFNSLIQYQEKNKKYRFSQNNKGTTYVEKSTTHITK